MCLLFFQFTERSEVSPNPKEKITQFFSRDSHIMDETSLPGNILTDSSVAKTGAIRFAAKFKNKRRHVWILSPGTTNRYRERMER